MLSSGPRPFLNYGLPNCSISEASSILHCQGSMRSCLTRIEHGSQDLLDDDDGRDHCSYAGSIEKAATRRSKIDPSFKR